MKNKILKIILFLSIVLEANDISSSRETAITRAINKVGPAVASINVEQHISSISLDPFLGFIYPKEIWVKKVQRGSKAPQRSIELFIWSS